ncbi:putative polysaccharide biosynthesis protein [Actinoplanes missouriensis 431]|uniref:Putative polysaccharide biosynthesis protein n=1 Tax=Actinoplanes missouriensis (strain ATCC 14538 / DSM 43046 / CBS 188.64 / JCM 3121 / NBRC 102363 / NCIMB 12654 / NRRL B-3342 / UNCC 431) TaxID=512565 RepID=I0HD10_ACTM4|nr:putative polysaccharide biosynthesis protein [Actinoplanes missouriensis]BAL90897.1 putative polysaccharide biosynthesis protein [Actinoplanes missouriensis 431]
MRLLRAVPRAVRRDYAASLLSQWFVLGIGLFLFYVVARRGGAAGFAYYQIARGVVSSFQPLAMIGLGQGLHRYLPRTSTGTERLARQAFGIQAAVTVGLMLLGIALGPQVSRLLGLHGGTLAVAAIMVMLIGNCLCSTAVAALRGSHQVARANTISAVGFGLTPILAVPAAGPVEHFLLAQGAGMILVAAWGTFTVRHRSPAPPAPAWSRSEPTLRTLMGYGLRRLPGDMALPALFTYPTFAVAVALPGGPEAGFVGFASSAVTLICSLFGTLTPVLLPRLSRLFQHGAVADGPDPTRSMLLRLPLYAALLAAVAAAFVASVAPTLVTGFLGPEFTGAIGVLRLGVLSAIPLAVFYAARPTLDALLDRPVISRLLLACLALQVTVTHVAQLTLPAPHAAVLALCVAATVLGAGAHHLVVRALRP